MADTPNYAALYEEAERRRQEEERRRQEAERRLQQAEIEAERSRQTIRETATFNSLLQEELHRLQELHAPQNFQSYLAQVSKLHAHLARLIPTPRQPALVATSSSRTTTSGRTSIARKYYPLRLRPWEDFRAVHERTFSRIYSALNDQQALPSRQSVQQDEVSLLEQLPPGVFQLPGSMSAARTDEVIKASLLVPASRIMNEYLARTTTDTDTKQKIFFDTATNGADTQRPGPSVDTDSDDNTRRSSTSSTVNPRKVMPDCLVLTMQTGPLGQVSTDNGVAARRAAVGEHKPAHAVRSTSVMEIVGHLPENYMLRLAREALARRRKRLATTDGELAHEQAGHDDMAAPRLIEGSNPSTRRIDKQTYFAYALSQTYHYMVLSGVAFGYLCTGETITFLCIHEDDPVTLLYHTSAFPLEPLADARSPPGPVTTAADTSVLDEDALSKMAIAQLCSFCVLALGSEVRPAVWTSNALVQLAQFPELPASSVAQRASGSSSLGTHGRDSDDDGDNSRSRMLSPFGDGHGRSVGSGPSPLRQEVHSGQDVPSSSEGYQRPASSLAVKPTLPYCTQACLLGLVQDGELDPKCPNYRLHRQCTSQPGHGHPIKQADLARLVRRQLFETPDVNCECHFDHMGSIGYALTITLTGFGYTFVGKAVEEQHRKRLMHEVEMYDHLLPLQGITVPVNLGLVDLIVPYPERVTFALLKSVMLLSYAGKHITSIDQDNEDADGAEIPVNIEREYRRTLQELRDVGIWDSDDNSDNVMWSDDVQRVMRIDFDRAVFLPSRDNSQTSDTPLTPGTKDTAPVDDGGLLKEKRDGQEAMRSEAKRARLQ